MTGEHYFRDKPLGFHAERLPRYVTWHADPEGAREILELKCAGFTVRKRINNQRSGIAAVRARLENGTLGVGQGACSNLLAEAQLYHYDPDAEGSEKPLKDHDHALDALRYLVARMDQGKVAAGGAGGAARRRSRRSHRRRPNRSGSGCRSTTSRCGRRSGRFDFEQMEAVPDAGGPIFPPADRRSEAAPRSTS